MCQARFFEMARICAALDSDFRECLVIARRTCSARELHDDPPRTVATSCSVSPTRCERRIGACVLAGYGRVVFDADGLTGDVAVVPSIYRTAFDPFAPLDAICAAGCAACRSARDRGPERSASRCSLVVSHRIRRVPGVSGAQALHPRRPAWQKCEVVARIASPARRAAGHVACCLLEHARRAPRSPCSPAGRRQPRLVVRRRRR